nr:hypothetical protein [Thermostichus lividus]
MLANALKSLVDPSAVRQVLAELGLPPESRAEALSLRDWLALSEALEQAQQNE